jgi:hypothetical protein
VVRNHDSCASITQVLSNLRVHSRRSPLLGWLTESDTALLSDLVMTLLDLDTRGVRGRVYAPQLDPRQGNRADGPVLVATTMLSNH